MSTEATDLPLELVQQIIQCIYSDGSPLATGTSSLQHNLVSASRVNCAWCQCATPLLYRRPQIRSIGGLNRFLFTLQNTDQGVNIVALHLDDFALSAEKSRRKWGLIGPRTPLRDKALDTLINLCPNLIELHLNLVVPRDWILSGLPIHPRNYVARLQILDLGPSVHWLAQAFFQNTIDCANITSLTLRNSPTTSIPRWCSLPRLKSLRIIAALPLRILVTLLQHVARTLEHLSIERYTFHFFYWPTLPQLRTLELTDITSSVPLCMTGVFLASLPALERMSLSNVEVHNALWADTLRLQSLTIGEPAGRICSGFHPSPGDILNLLTQVNDTLTHLEIYDTAIVSVPENPIGPIEPRTRTFIPREQVERTYFTPTLICCLPTLVSLRSLRVTCRMSTAVSFILHLPRHLEVLRIRSLMTGNRLEDMLVLGGDTFPPSSLKELELVVAERYGWIDEWLTEKLREAGVFLAVKKDN